VGFPLLSLAQFSLPFSGHLELVERSHPIAQKKPPHFPTPFRHLEPVERSHPIAQKNHRIFPPHFVTLSLSKGCDPNRVKIRILNFVISAPQFHHFLKTLNFDCQYFTSKISSFSSSVTSMATLTYFVVTHSLYFVH